MTEDAPASNPSLLAHRLADALYRHFTREPSPFLPAHHPGVRKAGNNRDIAVADWDGGNPVVLPPKVASTSCPQPATTAHQVTRVVPQEYYPDLYVQRPNWAK